MPSKTIVAILSITALLALALCLGFNGVLLSSGIAVISGLGGYAISRKKQS